MIQFDASTIRKIDEQCKAGKVIEVSLPFELIHKLIQSEILPPEQTKELLTKLEKLQMV